MGGFSSEIITTWEGFKPLEAEWNGLLSSSNSDSIFLTWEWINSWVEISKKHIQPFVFVVRDSENVLKGVAPFYLSLYRFCYYKRIKILRFLADEGTGLEYPDWIISRDCTEEVISAFSSLLGNSQSKWDCIWMSRVAGWTKSFENISKICDKSRSYLNYRPYTFALLDLPDSTRAFYLQMSRNRRSQMNRQNKKILDRKEVTFFLVKNIKELKENLDVLFELHNTRWEKKGIRGTFFRKPDEVLFYKKFCPIALKKGWLKLYIIRKNNVAKAIQIGYVYNGVFYQIQEGFDPEFHTGVGNVLRLNVIEDCIVNGIRHYDFLGEFGEHKRRWMAKKRLGFDIFMGKRNLFNFILFKLKIWPTGRYLSLISK